MSKFKIGDEVRIVSVKFDWKKQYRGKTFVITEYEGVYDGEPSWSATDGKSFGMRWKESELELVHTKGFEVGKVYKYRHSNSLPSYNVEAVLSNGHAAATTDSGRSILLKTFSMYEEVKPEDWRCLHNTWDTPSLGGISYKSESEVTLVYKNSPNFIKAVRVDA